MPVLNITCPICTEVFQNSDDIYSTSCGHIYHYTCMNDWKRRSTSCPQCRHYNPTTHKLYLSFDEFEDNSAKLEDIQLKLQTSEEKTNELLMQMQDAENNFMQLQQQFTTAEKTKKELEQQIRQIKDYEDDFLRLQAQYTESSEMIKELEDHINQLLIENECKTKELRAKTLENESLKVNLEGGQQSFLSDSALGGKIRILEQKIKHISEEFEKEIHTSTQLSIEKMKLESYIKHLDTGNKTKEAAQDYNNDKSNSMQNRQKQKRENLNKTRNERKELQNNRANSDCVFINELPLEQITLPLENVIVKLAMIMKLSISSDDLVKANLVNDEENILKAKLFAQFRSSDMKNKFVARWSFLKNDPTTKFIVIGDFNDEELNGLFMYTHTRLSNNGFKCIKSVDNKIFVKRHRQIRNAIRIFSKSQVDELQATNKPDEKPALHNRQSQVDELQTTNKPDEKPALHNRQSQVDELQTTNKPAEKPAPPPEKLNYIDEYFYQL